MRTGRPAGWHEAGPDDPLWEAYIRGLYEVSRAEHDGNAALVGVSDPREMVDVAGGHGAFAMAMCRRHPDLRATVLDLPASAAVGRRIVAEAGYADRVDFREGDALEADLGEDLDVVSVFNLVHHLSPADNARLLGRAHAAAPGRLCRGRRDRAPGAGRAGAPDGRSSGLLFYAISRARTYTVAEMTAWLEGEVEVHRNRGHPGGWWSWPARRLHRDRLLDWPRDPADRRHGAHRLHAAAAADGPARARALPGARSAAARRPAGARADRARRPHRSAVVSPPCGASARSSTSRRRSATSPGARSRSSTA